MTINPDECTVLQNIFSLSEGRFTSLESRLWNRRFAESIGETVHPLVFDRKLSKSGKIRPGLQLLVFVSLLYSFQPGMAADDDKSFHLDDSSVFLPGEQKRILIAMSDEVRSMCEQAEQLINSRKTKEAINLLNRAQSMDPSCGEVHGYLGMAFQNSGNPQQAIPEYMKALQLNPEMTFINVNLGTCLMNMNQMDKAVPYFQQYLNTTPNAPDAAQVRGYIQQAGARQGQQNLRPLVEQGQSLLNARRFPEAQAAFRQALGVDPNFAPAHFYLAFSLAQGGQPQQAISEFQETLRLDPSIKEAILNIGSNYQSLGDCQNAIAWYQRYLKESPGSPKAGEIQQRIQGLQQQMQRLGGTPPPPPPPQGGGMGYGAQGFAGGGAPGFAGGGAPGFAGGGTGFAGGGAPGFAGGGTGFAGGGAPGFAGGGTGFAGGGTPGFPGGAPGFAGGGAPGFAGGGAPGFAGGGAPGFAGGPGFTGGGPGFTGGGAPNMGGQAPPDDYITATASGGKYFRWTHMPIRVFIASGTGVPGYQKSYNQVLMDAFSDWAVGSENRISFTLTSDQKQSDIFCDWTGDSKRVVEHGRPVEGGLTKLNGQPMPNGVDVSITSAKVTILTNRSGTPLSTDDMKKVCLHEVGHALGINGHSNNNTDVMFFSESPTVSPTLSPRDRATICRLYNNR